MPGAGDSRKGGKGYEGAIWGQRSEVRCRARVLTHGLKSNLGYKQVFNELHLLSFIQVQ